MSYAKEATNQFVYWQNEFFLRSGRQPTAQEVFESFHEQLSLLTKAKEEAHEAFEIVKKQHILALSDAVKYKQAAESVVAWEAKMLEPLRREVAMLRHKLLSVIACEKLKLSSRPDASTDLLRMCESGIELTQATAEAYERELKAKVLEKLRARLVVEQCSSSHPYNAIDAELSELRAQSAKKEGE